MPAQDVVHAVVPAWPFERLIKGFAKIGCKLLFSKDRATLAQLVERLIRNFHLQPYAIHSAFGQITIPLACLA
jgi:hypothetical protein